MKVIPAIDIKGGKVVRLTQGLMDKVKIYSDSPLEVAEHLASFDVELIHIVDLDGAIEGTPKNFDIIKKIAKTIKPKIELGGGIRDIETIRMILDSGIQKVILGTRALEADFLEYAAKEFIYRIVVGIDARDGIVHTKGWVFKTMENAIDLARKIEKAGIRTVNYTDISKDGMLEGPNIENLKEILRSTRLDVVASGGVTTIEDVIKLKALEESGLSGIIIGKAIYEHVIDLAEAIKICNAPVSRVEG